MFAQSYTLQVQWIMEPIFARLGVKHQSRNFGNGGMGTFHNAVASGSIYGPDVSMIMWDSGMTEREASAPDMLHVQSLLSSSTKAPLLVNGGSLLDFYRDLDADVANSAELMYPSRTR